MWHRQTHILKLLIGFDSSQKKLELFASLLSFPIPFKDDYLSNSGISDTEREVMYFGGVPFLVKSTDFHSENGDDPGKGRGIHMHGLHGSMLDLLDTIIGYSSAWAFFPRR